MARPRKTAGDRVVDALAAGLEPGVLWTEKDILTLDFIRVQTDRTVVLRGLLDAETVKVPVSTRRVAELAAEVRQLEANVAKLVSGLVIDVDDVPVKSARHQYAARVRWGASG